jgi:hypothetical protein
MPFLRGLRAAAAIVLSALALVACGGGGGGGPEPVCLTFDQAGIVATFVQAQQKDVNADQDATAVVSLTATGPIVGQAYAYVVDEDDVFSPVLDAVVALGPGRYELTLRANPGLPVGTYRGTVQVRLCKDLQCTDEYEVTEGVLSYAVTVVPQLSVEVFLDDFPEGTATSATLIPVMVPAASGKRLRVTSNVPMVVAFENVPGSYEFVVDPTSTPTDWRADVVVTPSMVTWTSVQVRAADSAVTTERPVNIYVEF